jgi:hypothetical protein
MPITTSLASKDRGERILSAVLKKLKEKVFCREGLDE